MLNLIEQLTNKKSKIMKKVLVIAAIAAFGFTNAQETSFGVKAGLNLATIVGDVDNADMRTSFHIGGIAEIPLAQDFFFGPELLYSAQGVKEEETEGGVTAEYVLKLDYIQIPLMFKYFVSDGLSLDLGPQIGFLMSAKEEVEVSGGDSSLSDSEDVKEFFSGFDYGLNVGLGYRLESGLFFQGRYNIGLANIFDVDEDTDFSAQNSVIQFSVGFMF